MVKKNCITDIEGVKVGQISDKQNLTGCTVVLIPEGAVCGIEVCGGAPGSRESSLLASDKDNSEVHAIFLAGGSAYGLAVGDGIMKFLEENNIGFDTGYAKIPIVPGAVLFDLNVRNSVVRPTAEMGYKACKVAKSSKIKEGNEGAGTGATVGKILGDNNMMKGGIGSASFVGKNGLVMGAIVAVNAFGDIRDYRTGRILAGSIVNNKLQDTIEFMKSNLEDTYQFKSNNTTIAIIGTNANLSKTQCNILAKIATHGLIRSIHPVCTTLDGDTIFAFSKGTMKCDINTLGSIASQVLSEAIENAIKAAEEIDGIKAYNSL